METTFKECSSSQALFAEISQRQKDIQQQISSTLKKMRAAQRRIEKVMVTLLTAWVRSRPKTSANHRCTRSPRRNASRSAKSSSGSGQSDSDGPAARPNTTGLRFSPSSLAISAASIQEVRS